MKSNRNRIILAYALSKRGVDNMSMFCYQCQETARNQGCTVRGVCGKTDEVANLQDTLIYLLKGISSYATRARKLGVSDNEVDDFVMKGLFSTITNVNFDPGRMEELIMKAVEMRERIKNKFLDVYKEKNGKDFDGKMPDAATWYPEGGRDEFIAKGTNVGILSQENEDIRSLRETIILGLKGIAAYADHAAILGYRDDGIFAFLQEGLAATTDDALGVDDLVGLALKAGEMAVGTMALLDKANTESYGTPEPTQVNIGVRDRPGILISGHDLLDLAELLEQSKDSGVDIYTHGEMLPANSYPAFKKYGHLAGNYGNSWWHQTTEFDKFNGPIIMTTNCLVPPRDSYKDRVYTTGVVAFPDVKHISDRKPGEQKDFSGVIEHALKSKAPEELETGIIPGGFAHGTIMSVADKVVEAVKSGAIKRFFVMAGCDGRHKDRSYFTNLAENLPKDTIILTAGCAKYRYNKLGLGDIGGIPRVIDAGQCNDSYSLAVVALKLAEVFGVESINDLPVSFDIAWYEQKAVAVLLALLHLGVKGIRLGPTLPAFLSPNVAKVLVENFDIKLTSTADEDLAAMMEGN